MVSVFTRQPQVGPAALARLAGARDVLTRAGYTPDQTIRIYAAVHTYTLGFCALEAARNAASRDEAIPLEDDAATVATLVSEDQFEFGLRALVVGLAAKPGPKRVRTADRDGRRAIRRK